MINHLARHRARVEMQAATDTLIREFGHLVSAATVVRQLARAREDRLVAGVRNGLAHAAEAMARARLQRIVPAHAAPFPTDDALAGHALSGQPGPLAMVTNV